MAGMCALGMGFEFPPGSRLRGWPCVWEVLHKQGLLLPRGQHTTCAEPPAPPQFMAKSRLGLEQDRGVVICS